jgi:putative RecB family exonuclease
MTESRVPTLANPGSLSPSRAADFKTCPLLYRFRTIDRIPEAPSSAATRGTVVHAVLQQLFELAPAQRTAQAAKAMIEPVWQQLLADEPELATLFPAGSADGELDAWLASAYQLVDNYFTLEDPARLDPQACEQLVEVEVGGLLLRGYIDRIDVSDAGDIRIVDYKTGAVPREAFEAKALFQMKFYALVLWRLRGVVARQLKLIYLADRETLSYTPDAAELERFEGTLRAIWAAIDKAVESAEFKPSPSRLCDWCDHHVRCPAFGGTPPPYPVTASAGAVEQLQEQLAGSEELAQERRIHVAQ